MSETCPTVKVKTEATEDNPEGFIVINESDFDAETHELFDAEKPAAKPSDGLKVEEIKAALAANGIEIPDGVTLKADLAALLDA